MIILYTDLLYQHLKKIVHKCGQITPYLRNLGIERGDRVYYTPDPSMNISLYLMDQLGNTDFSLRGSRKERIEHLKEKGLKYLMIGDEKILKKASLKDYTSKDKKIGEFNGVHIFKVE